jgi:hypothetical protein
MKNFICVLLTIFFVSSCNTIQRKAVCNEVANYQVEETDSYFYRKGRCYSARFDINSWLILEDYTEVPLEKCDGLQGVKVEVAVSEIIPKFTALQRIRSEQCR